MLCSLGELGLTAARLPLRHRRRHLCAAGEDCDHTLGKPICEAIGSDDTTVEFEITSNRPDCLSVIGLAREAAATFDKDRCSCISPVVKGGHGDSTPELLGRPGGRRRTCAMSIRRRWSKMCASKPSPALDARSVCAPWVCVPSTTSWTSPTMSCWNTASPCMHLTCKLMKDGQIRVRRAKDGETHSPHLDGVERARSPRACW